MSIFTADVLVKLDGKMIAELNRSTKKNPPTRMKYELIYVGSVASFCPRHNLMYMNRLERANMTLVRVKTRSMAELRAAFSRAFVRTLMGKPLLSIWDIS